MNVITWLDIELTYYDVAVQHVSKYPTMTLPRNIIITSDFFFCIKLEYLIPYNCTKSDDYWPMKNEIKTLQVNVERVFMIIMRHLHSIIFIIKVFRTIVFILIVISTKFRLICPPAFFRCLSNSGTFTVLRTTSFIETTGVACSDSICHNRVQVLSTPVYYSPVVRIEPATFRWLSS